MRHMHSSFALLCSTRVIDSLVSTDLGYRPRSLPVEVLDWKKKQVEMHLPRSLLPTEGLSTAEAHNRVTRASGD